MRPNGLAVQNSFPHERERKKKVEHEENKRQKKICESIGGYPVPINSQRED